MKKLSIIAKSLAALALVSSASASFAASTWDLPGLCTADSNGLVSACAGNTTGGGNITSVTGWSTGTGTIAVPTAGTNFASAAVYEYTSGLGVVATNESPNTTGPHSTDNLFGTDAFLFKFGTAINLNSLSIGFNGTDNPTGNYVDSDVSVLAWTGAAAPTLTNAPVAGLLAAGWKLIGNFTDVGASNGATAGGSASFSATNGNGTALYSSYWLISAYDSNFGGGFTTANDSFKLLSLAGNTCTAAGGVTGTQCGGTKVPEPGSLALFGLGLIGLVASRRRKQATV
jgi:PEP-CTERM motif